MAGLPLDLLRLCGWTLQWMVMAPPQRNNYSHRCLLRHKFVLYSGSRRRSPSPWRCTAALVALDSPLAVVAVSLCVPLVGAEGTDNC